MIKGLNTCKKQLNLKAEIKLEFSDYEIRCMHGEVINSTEKIQLNEQAEKIITYVSNYLKVNKLML
jgi:hypothetical protein